MEKHYNLIEDVNTTTSIPINTQKNLCIKATQLICQDVFETMQSNEDITVVDIGIGELCIKVCGDKIQYKFNPNSYLERAVLDTVKNNVAPLEKLISESLAAKICKSVQNFF